MFKIGLCLLIIFISVISILLPNRIIDTSSCKMNWTFILIILAGCASVIEEDEIAVILMLILMLGIVLNRIKIKGLNIGKPLDEI